MAESRAAGRRVGGFKADSSRRAEGRGAGRPWKQGTPGNRGQPASHLLVPSLSLGELAALELSLHACCIW